MGDSVPLDLRAALAAGGETGALIASTDWAATPLGSMDCWPARLRAAVAVLLRSPFAMHVGWGPDLLQLYNDAYRPMLGSTKHPAIGRPVAETFAEVYDTLVAPRYAVALEGRGPYRADDLMLPLDRHGWLEEAHFAGSYSSLDGDDGRIAGVLTICMETTAQVLGARRLALLAELSATAHRHDRVDRLVEAMVATIAGCPDTPAVVVVDAAPDRAPVLAASGVLDPPSALAVGVGALDDRGASSPEGRIPLEALGLRAMPHASWPMAPTHAVVVAAGDRRLIVALHPGLWFDEAYRRFLEVVGESVAGAIGRAQRLEQTRAHLASLRELDAAKDALLSDVSHELRTPLTLISGTLEQLRARGDLPAEQRQDLWEVAERNVARLARLVDSLLAFGRLAAGHLRAEPRLVDLAELTAEVCAAFEPEFRRAGLAFALQRPGGPTPVVVDPQLWETVVFNLLSNAHKFTLRGGVEVRLRRAGADRVRLEVVDTGVGIAAQHLDRLFQRFYRVRGPARTEEGAGIGLALVRSIVEQCWGSVEVHSSPGVGTTFTVTLPAAPTGAELRAGTGAAASPEDGHRGAAAPDPVALDPVGFDPGALDPGALDPGALDPCTGPPGRRATILVVDDSDDLRQLVTLALSPRWAVRTAGDGHEALAALGDGPVDLVVTDAMMPAMDGPALIRALRADPRTARLPVVLLSGMGEPAERSGADAVLAKPIRLAELGRTIAALLEPAGARPTSGSPGPG